MEAAQCSLAARTSPGRPVTAQWKGQLAEREMEEVVVGIKARHSCLTASQRLLRCVSVRSTGDPTGVYPQLCKLQTSIICSPRATAWAPPPLIPHTSVSRVRQKENFANLGRGVIFSSGDGGPLHSALPHPLPHLPCPHFSLLDWTGRQWTWVLLHQWEAGSCTGPAPGACVFLSSCMCLVVALATAHTAP